MYNIIKSNYEIIFFIFVSCIIVFLFINSQKIVEGISNKQINEQVKKELPSV